MTDIQSNHKYNHYFGCCLNRMRRQSKFNLLAKDQEEMEKKDDDWVEMGSIHNQAQIRPSNKGSAYVRLQDEPSQILDDKRRLNSAERRISAQNKQRQSEIIKDYKNELKSNQKRSENQWREVNRQVDLKNFQKNVDIEKVNTIPAQSNNSSNLTKQINQTIPQNKNQYPNNQNVTNSNINNRNSVGQYPNLSTIQVPVQHPNYMNSNYNNQYQQRQYVPYISQAPHPVNRAVNDLNGIFNRSSKVFNDTRRQFGLYPNQPMYYQVNNSQINNSQINNSQINNSLMNNQQVNNQQVNNQQVNNQQVNNQQVNNSQIRQPQQSQIRQQQQSQFRQPQNSQFREPQNSQIRQSQLRQNVPQMTVHCDKCTFAQSVPGNAQIYICCMCNQMNQCFPLYGVFCCGICKANVIYPYGTSHYIKCTRCLTVNKVNPQPKKRPDQSVMMGKQQIIKQDDIYIEENEMRRQPQYDSSTQMRRNEQLQGDLQRQREIILNRDTFSQKPFKILNAQKQNIINNPNTNSSNNLQQRQQVRPNNKFSDQLIQIDIREDPHSHEEKLLPKEILELSQKLDESLVIEKKESHQKDDVIQFPSLF